MSSTLHPAFNEPLNPEITLEDIRQFARERQREMKNDEDKAGDMYDSAYYEGQSNAMFDILCYMIGKKPSEVSEELLTKLEKAPEASYWELQDMIDANKL